MTVRIIEGDCRDVLRTLPDASVHSIVTDPPYELGFMGKPWDKSGITYDEKVWRECLRVLKPGGHLLAFGGSRTYHRLACAIEDAGFEIRDQIMWLYGSGFPKSLDVSKAIDRVDGNARGRNPDFRNGPNTNHATNGSPKIVGGYAGSGPMDGGPVSQAAREWDGWGTALKPAHEPIVVARKPLIGTVAANALTHGCGALNIDGCRVAGGTMPPNTGSGGLPRRNVDEQRDPGIVTQPHDLGRWPANVVHDGSDEVLSAFPDAPSQQGDLREHSKDRKSRGIFGDMPAARDAIARKDGGSAARFFYCAKASKADREAGCDGLPTKRGGMVSNTSGQHITRLDGGDPGELANHHPTVKPTDLMRWLVRLVTPPGGIVLDPFMGSGSTGRGAVLEGFGFVGVELCPEYAAIAEARISHAAKLRIDAKSIAEDEQRQSGLFGEARLATHIAKLERALQRIAAYEGAARNIPLHEYMAAIASKALERRS